MGLVVRKTKIKKHEGVLFLYDEDTWQFIGKIYPDVAIKEELAEVWCEAYDTLKEGEK